MTEQLQANEGKALTNTADGVAYDRLPIKTHVVMPDDDLRQVVRTYAAPVVQDGDILFVTE